MQSSVYLKCPSMHQNIYFGRTGRTCICLSSTARKFSHHPQDDVSLPANKGRKRQKHAEIETIKERRQCKPGGDSSLRNNADARHGARATPPPPRHLRPAAASPCHARRPAARLASCCGGGLRDAFPGRADWFVLSAPYCAKKAPWLQRSRSQRRWRTLRTRDLLVQLKRPVHGLQRRIPGKAGHQKPGLQAKDVLQTLPRIGIAWIRGTMAISRLPLKGPRQ